MEREYFKERPSLKLRILEIHVPCGYRCLSKTSFSPLLEKGELREQLEIIDSLIDLIESHIDSLLTLLEEGVGRVDNLENLAFAVYRAVEEGGEFVVGEELKFGDRVIASGSFERLSELSSKIDRIRRDQEVKRICDEIRYLSESLWTHFDKNVKRVLHLED